MFKKLLSVLISVIVILSAICGTLTVGAAEAVISLDFESYPSGGALNKFKIADTGDAAQGKALYGNFTAADANLSPAAALMTKATDAKLEKGTTYEVSLKYKAVNINSSFAFNMYYTDNANSYVRKKVSGTTTNTAAAVSPYLVRFSHANPGKTVLNEWIEVTASFTAEYDSYVYLGLWTNAVTEFYIDDLKITKVTAVKVSFNTNGGSTIEPLSGSAGAALSTLPLPTKDNVSFMGWYSDEELTTPFIATTFPEGDITLYAKWIDEGTYSQTFEGYNVSGSIATNTLSVYTKKSETDPFVHGGNRSLYKPAVNSSYFVSPFPYATKKLEQGKGYKLNMWVYVPQEVEKANEGAWQLTLLDDNANAFSVGDRKKINIKYFNSTFNEGEWQQLELIFTASADGFMGLYAYGGFEMYIDDITLIEVDTVTVSFDTCGGDPLESLMGPVGLTVSSAPTPTHPEKMAFAGWFTDKEYTERFTFKEFPENDVTLYAKWIKKGSFEQTFEGYYYENDTANGTYSKDVLSIYHATSDNDKYVHSGKASMRYYQKLIPESKTYGFSIFDPTMGQLEIGEKYYVSYWIKPKEITSTFYHAVYNNSVVDNMFANYNMKGYFTTHTDVIGKTGDVSEYFFGPAEKYSVSEPDENGWIKFTYETTATDKYFSIYVNWDAEVYIDDVVIEPLPTGVVDAEYSKPYCEQLYDEINYQQPEAFNKKSDAVQIYPIEVDPRGDYVFSAAVSKAAKEGYIALSFDSDGKDIIEGTKVSAGESVSLRMMMSKEPLLYLVVYNPIGEGMVERATLCRTAAAKETISTQKPAYNYTEDELPELSELMKEPAYKEIFLDAEFETEFSDGSDTEASPKTGENSFVLAVMLLAFGSLAVMVICYFKKGGVLFVKIKKYYFNSFGALYDAFHHRMQ